MGRPMLTVDALHKASKPYVELHNYYNNNYKSGQDIIVSYEDHHFLVGDGIFLISLDVSNALLRIVSLQNLASPIYILNICVICV
jgi:hypothetical protein